MNLRFSIPFFWWDHVISFGIRLIFIIKQVVNRISYDVVNIISDECVDINQNMNWFPVFEACCYLLTPYDIELLDNRSSFGHDDTFFQLGKTIADFDPKIIQKVHEEGGVVFLFDLEINDLNNGWYAV